MGDLSCAPLLYRMSARFLTQLQGFQTVCTVASRNFTLLQDTDAENISLPLTWVGDPSKSRFLFGFFLFVSLCFVVSARAQDVRKSVLFKRGHTQQSRYSSLSLPPRPSHTSPTIHHSRRNEQSSLRSHTRLVRLRLPSVLHLQRALHQRRQVRVALI